MSPPSYFVCAPSRLHFLSMDELRYVSPQMLHTAVGCASSLVMFTPKSSKGS